MDISNGQKSLATRADLKRLGIIVSNSTLLRWEARGRFPRRVRLAGKPAENVESADTTEQTEGEG